MTDLRPIAQRILPLIAGFIFTTTVHAEYVTGFEHDTTGLPVPNVADPSTWVQIPVAGGGETVPFGSNSATFTGGAWVWANAPDFYRDGNFEWAFSQQITFAIPVTDVDFSFWALLGPNPMTDPFDIAVNGGAATGVSVQAFNAADELVDSALPLALVFDGMRIGPEGVVNLSGPGIVKIAFNVDVPPGPNGLIGYGIDGLNASTVPLPAALWLLLACLPTLGWRRAKAI